MDVRYGTSRSFQCSCISLISLSRTLFTSPGLWDKLDLDFALGKGNHLFKSIGKFKHLGIEDLAQKFLIKISYVNVELPENKTGEITAGAYLLSTAEIVNGVH